jgi:hypothetical protein
MFLRNVGFYKNHTAPSYLRRWHASSRTCLYDRQGKEWRYFRAHVKRKRFSETGSVSYPMADFGVAIFNLLVGLPILLFMSSFDSITK